MQSGRQGRFWREVSGWTLRGKREPRRAGAVEIWSAGLLASAGRSDWTVCPIPSRPSYRASFGLRRRPAARLGIGGRATHASISVYMGKCGESGDGSWQSGVLSHPHARFSTSCLVNGWAPGVKLGVGRAGEGRGRPLPSATATLRLLGNNWLADQRVAVRLMGQAVAADGTICGDGAHSSRGVVAGEHSG